MKKHILNYYLVLQLFIDNVNNVKSHKIYFSIFFSPLADLVHKRVLASVRVARGVQVLEMKIRTAKMCRAKLTSPHHHLWFSHHHRNLKVVITNRNMLDFMQIVQVVERSDMSNSFWILCTFYAYLYVIYSYNNFHEQCIL